MTTATRVRRVNAQIATLPPYPVAIPISALFAACAAEGYGAVQEDGTPWAGVLCGREGRATIEMRDLREGRAPRWLMLGWYRMPSGRYEVTAYVS